MLRYWMRHLFSAAHKRAVRPQRYRLCLELLEDRTVPYVLSGFQWANPNVSVSFMPDGTLIAGAYPSNLFAVYDAAYAQATWQRQIALALQAWADVSNLNFHFVSDNGAPQGTAGLAQGDPRFGDIRIGGYNMGSGILGIGWNPNSTTTGGDVELNTSSAFVIGSIPDLASIVMHEVGHGIGFNHTLVNPAVMEGGLWGTYPGPYADDIGGVQAMYGARKTDVFDSAASNDTLGSATALTLSYGGIAFQADISTMADVDYYRITAPAGTDGTLNVSVDARNLSLFDPKVSVYDASGTLLGTASASTYGDVATVHLTGLVAGQTYYLEASGATTDAFGMGAYRLSAQFGGFSPPPIGPDAFEPNNSVGAATNFGKVTSMSQSGLTLSSPTDVDYYTFVAGDRGTFAVSVTPTQGSGMLSLTVLSAQQTVLASGQSLTGGITLSVNVTSGTQYYIKVSSPSASLFAYTLSIGAASISGGGAGSSGGHGGHHLVAMGAVNLDDPAQGDVFFQNAADDSGNAGSRAAPAHGEVSRVSPIQLSQVELAAAAGVVVTPGPVGAFPNRPGNPIDTFVALRHQSSSVPAVLPFDLATDSRRFVEPELPPLPYDSGVGPQGDEDPEAVLLGCAVQKADQSDTPVMPAAERQPPPLLQQTSGAEVVEDSGFTNSSLPSPGIAMEDSGTTADTATIALAFALVGYVGVVPEQKEERIRRVLI